MPIKRTTDPANRLTTLTATGSVRPEEVAEIVGAFATDPPSKNILSDFREAFPAASFNADRTMELASLAKAAIGSRFDGKTAFVAASEVIRCMWIKYTEQLKQRGTFHQTRIFGQIEDALTWFDEDR